MNQAERLRLRVESERRAGAGGGGRGFSEGLRDDIVRLVTHERARGESDEVIAGWLGVTTVTLRRWAPKGSRGAFQELVVVATETRTLPPAVPVVVVGPAGMRVLGLDVEGIVELWRRLGC
jgi:hypothetical protein